MPTGAKWAIISMLVLVLIVAVVVGRSILKDRAETNRVNEVLQEAKALNDDGKIQNGIELDQEQLQGVLNRTTSAKETENRALLLKTLAYAKAKGDYNVNQTIIDHVIKVNTRPSIRADIFKTVMTRRKAIENVAPLLAYAKSTQENESAAAAIQAALSSATGQPADDYIDDFLNLISDSDSSTVRGAAERAAATLIAQSDSKDDFVIPILSAYKTAIDDSAKFAMLRLLGATGGDKAAKAVTQALKSDSTVTASAALAALGNWADDSQFNTLIEYLESEDDQGLRKKAFDSSYAFLRNGRKRDPDAAGEMWKSLAKNASSQSEKLQIISGMANQKHAWAITSACIVMVFSSIR